MAYVLWEGTCGADYYLSFGKLYATTRNFFSYFRAVGRIAPILVSSSQINDAAKLQDVQKT